MKVHSIQTLGTLDGPGVRFVVFLQGCHLRCKCCHNPDTWDTTQGKDMTPEEVADRASRYKEYFGKDGGITVSGGEPLLQSKEVAELFSLCRQNSINTCLDTSGSIMNDDVKKLLSVTDRVLLDIKYTDDEDYRENVGCSLTPVLDFLGYIDKRSIPVTLRQVIIPTLNDTAENINILKEIRNRHQCVDSVELLAFRKLCKTKYDNLGISFPLSDIPEPTKEQMDELRMML